MAANYRGLGLADMARGIADRRPHRANGDLGLHVLAVMEGILEAATESSESRSSSNATARCCSRKTRPPRCWPEPEGEEPAPRLAPAIAPRQGPPMLRPPVFGILIGLLLLGRWLAPAVDTSLDLAAAGDDPVKASDVLIARGTDSTAIARAIDEALAGGDADLADSLVALSDRGAIPIDAGRRAAVAEAAKGSVLDTGRDFLRGAIVGDVGGGTGLAGAFAGDLVGIGDVRDLGREGWRIANGEEPDRLVMGLAAAGLAVTAATWISVGEAAPIRGGLTIVKALRKAGRLSAGMTVSVGRLLRRSVDVAGLRRATGSLAHLDVAAARQAAADAIRPGMMAPLAALGRDTSTLFRRAGARAVEDSVALARSPAELGRAARLSEGMGRATRGALKILGRSAIVLGEGLAMIAGWIIAGGLWALAIALAAARFGRRLGAMGRRGPRRHVPNRIRTSGTVIAAPRIEPRIEVLRDEGVSHHAHGRSSSMPTGRSFVRIEPAASARHDIGEPDRDDARRSAGTAGRGVVRIEPTA